MKNLHFGFMKILILSLITFLITTSCDVNEPKKNNQKPEGYQEDIEWPSLADSPWPMYHGNPQSNGRLKFDISINGNINWEYRNNGKYIISGIVIDKDSSIYAIYENDGLIILQNDGKVLKKINTNYLPSPTTPIITRDENIILFTNGGVYSIKKTGEINWEYLEKGQPSLGANIDKSGNIYFLNIEKRKIVALNGKNGNKIWEYIDERFMNNSIITISPDDKFLYLAASNYLIALDLVSKSLAWEYKDVKSQWNIVDSQGNIYLITENSPSENAYSLTSINKLGDLRWNYNFSTNSDDHTEFAQATIDRNGNVYFVSDSLFSISYKGELKWKLNISGKVLTPLICDNNNVYLEIFSSPGSFNFVKISNDGKIVFEIKKIEQNFGESPAFGFDNIIIPTGNDEKIYSIK